MRRLFPTTKRIVIVCAAVVLLGAAAAWAYFAATGSGAGTAAAVGPAGSWQVTEVTATGTMFPGEGSSQIVFSVKNTGAGDQEFSAAAASVSSSGGDITVGGSAVADCSASWFTASVTSDPSVNTDIAGGGMVPVTVTMTMPSDPSDNQDACQGMRPDVSLSVS